jgi:hypothetical protein
LTPERYQECLDQLGLSQRGLAPVLRCSDRLTRAWATGTATIPREIAVWLESCVLLRRGKPKARLPQPMEWRRLPIVPITHEGKRLSLKHACEAAGIARASVYYRSKTDGLSMQAAFNRVKKNKAARSMERTFLT